MNPERAKAVSRARAGEMPIDCGRHLAAPQRPQRAARRCPPRIWITASDDDDEHDHGEDEERLVVGEVPRPDHRAGAPGCPGAARCRRRRPTRASP